MFSAIPFEIRKMLDSSTLFNLFSFRINHKKRARTIFDTIVKLT